MDKVEQAVRSFLQLNRERLVVPFTRLARRARVNIFGAAARLRNRRQKPK
jgi:hypothetical protein